MKTYLKAFLIFHKGLCHSWKWVIDLLKSGGVIMLWMCWKSFLLHIWYYCDLYTVVPNSKEPRVHPISLGRSVWCPMSFLLMVHLLLWSLNKMSWVAKIDAISRDILKAMLISRLQKCLCRIPEVCCVGLWKPRVCIFFSFFLIF